MAFHDDFLALAREMVDRNLAASPPNDAELRRAVSTAYYALFHLLIHEATTRVIALPDLRGRVGRAIDHGPIRELCKTISEAKQNAAGEFKLKNGETVAAALVDVCSEFVALQEARLQADYAVGATITPAEADTNVQIAEAAFAEWAGVANHPQCGGVPGRNSMPDNQKAQLTLTVGRRAKVRRAIIDKGVIIPEDAVAGYDLEQDRRRGFPLSDTVIVVIAKDHGAGQLLSREQTSAAAGE